MTGGEQGATGGERPEQDGGQDPDEAVSLEDLMAGFRGTSSGAPVKGSVPVSAAKRRTPIAYQSASSPALCSQSSRTICTTVRRHLNDLAHAEPGKLSGKRALSFLR